MSQIPPKMQNSRPKWSDIPGHRPLISLPAKQPHIDPSLNAQTGILGAPSADIDPWRTARTHSTASERGPRAALWRNRGGLLLHFQEHIDDGPAVAAEQIGDGAVREPRRILLRRPGKMPELARRVTL